MKDITQLKSHIQTQREKCERAKANQEKHPIEKAMEEKMEQKAQKMEERWKYKEQKMQEKAKHLQDKAVKKEEKKPAKEKQKVQYERENERDESSSSAHPSRESNKVIIDNEIYEPTNIQLDPEQVDITRQQCLGDNSQIWVSVGFGLVALINSFGYWVFRRVNC